VDPHELIARIKRRLSDAHRLHEERRLQEVDELTGLDNRRAFRRRLTEACATAKRSGRPLSVAMIDADGLKNINDTWGHAAGDRAIEAVAAALTRSKRGGDCAARLGGDEFALVLPDTDEAGARLLCERIESLLAHSNIEVAGITFRVNVSTGVATLNAEGDDDMLARADASLYACKRSHKARAVAQPELLS
jgi:diguanylate cyclase (GGDEF)-like protein